MKKKKIIYFLYDNAKTLLGALVIAVLIRSLLFQPFYIPSSSMEPTLLVGDRFFSKLPERGDLVVFKTPADNRTDYIKRLIGLPGDKIQFINGDLYINEKQIKREPINQKIRIRCGNFFLETNNFVETLPNGVKHYVSYKKRGSLQNTKKFEVPINHFFLLGDNRDCSKDSRYLDSVGYVKKLNLVGEAKLIFFSNDTNVSSLLKFWNIKKSFRFQRLLKKL